MPAETSPRDKRVETRIDAGLLQAAAEKARALGGVSVVIRALLRLFVEGKITLRREDVIEELLPAVRAPKLPRPPKK